ncbi:MAG: 23S rRNA (uracil(1939)-C(5))-methyltransferase RlmD, partial [Butyrivibrio sp.]
MKKGQIYEGKVTGVNFPNKGIAECEEGTAIVKNTIPGQRIRFAVNKKKGGKCEGRLLEVLETSPLENNEKVCPHFGECGGCTYQNVGYEDQLNLKKNQVKKILDSVCSDYEFLGIEGSPITEGYRNKMEFSFGDEEKDGPLALGMHRKGSFYDIVTVENCRIVDEDFRRILNAVLEYFKERNLPFYHKLKHEGFLRHLLVRKAKKTGEILVDIVTTSQMDFNVACGDKSFADMLLMLPLKGTISGILHTVNDSLADVVSNDRTDILYGKDYITEELLGLRFKITPFSFFQTNSLGAEVLYDRVRSFVGAVDNKTIFDLYSGTGTIAQILDPVAKKVVGVEIVPEAVEAARENAALNGLANCEFIAGDVLKVVGELKDKPDIIVLDPPRDGIHPRAIEHIINFGVDRIVYVSCKPTSLARDLEIFRERGYRVEKAVCVDMFPGTYHVETVCLLSKLHEAKHPV